MPGTVDNKLIYHLGVLIPFWVLELIAELLVVVGGGLGLAYFIYVSNNVGCTYDEYGDYSCLEVNQDALNIGYAAAGVEVGLGCVFVILHIVQIALFGRRKLTPAANFGIELARFIVWLIVFILAIVSFSSYGGADVVGLAFAIVVWVLYLGSLIYAIVIFHRARRGHYNGSSTNYDMPTTGSAPAAYASGQPQVQETAMAPQEHYGPGPYQHPSEIQQNQYQSQTYQSSNNHISPISNAQPTQLGSAYAPSHSYTGSSEKETVNHGA